MNIDFKNTIYTAPVLECVDVELENGIAVGSATITPVGPDGSNTPQVEDWNDTDGGTYNFDV